MNFTNLQYRRFFHLAVPIQFMNKLSSQQKQDLIDCRKALHKIFSTLQYLASQGFSIRGKIVQFSETLQGNGLI